MPLTHDHSAIAESLVVLMPPIAPYCCRCFYVFYSLTLHYWLVQVLDTGWKFAW